MNQNEDIERPTVGDWLMIIPVFTGGIIIFCLAAALLNLFPE